LALSPRAGNILAPNAARCAAARALSSRPSSALAHLVAERHKRRAEAS
jgi:hypothetical protein